MRTRIVSHPHFFQTLKNVPQPAETAKSSPPEVAQIFCVNGLVTRLLRVCLDRFFIVGRGSIITRPFHLLSNLKVSVSSQRHVRNVWLIWIRISLALPLV